MAAAMLHNAKDLIVQRKLWSPQRKSLYLSIYLLGSRIAVSGYNVTTDVSMSWFLHQEQPSRGAAPRSVRLLLLGGYAYGAGLGVVRLWLGDTTDISLRTAMGATYLLDVAASLIGWTTMDGWKPRHVYAHHMPALVAYSYRCLFDVGIKSTKRCRVFVISVLFAWRHCSPHKLVCLTWVHAIHFVLTLTLTAPS